jgi:hypothetical protein
MLKNTVIYEKTIANDAVGFSEDAQEQHEQQMSERLLRTVMVCVALAVLDMLVLQRAPAQDSAHNYLLDTYKEKVEDVPRMPAQYLEPLLAGMHNRLRQTLPNGQNTAIVFDEWNTMWARSGSIAMSLYVGGVLNMLCRDASTLNIVQANYFMPINEGAIQVSPLDG